MGKRKERRLAAMMASNRRVKLDLFAEPSGEMVGSSAHEDGGNTDQDHHAVVPNSLSSPGEKQENPLLLLGQYSDDELDKETSPLPTLSADESSPNVLNDEGLAENVQCAESDINSDKQQAHQASASENLDEDAGKESVSALAAVECSESCPSGQINPTTPSGIGIDGGSSGGWKLVMHEESNQYYYWNTATGETSWEAHSALAGESVLRVEGDVSNPDTHLNSETANFAYTSAVDGLGDAGEGSNLLGIKNIEEVADGLYNANQVLPHAHHNDSTASISYVDPAELAEFGSAIQTSAASIGHPTVPVAQSQVLNNQDKDKHLRDPCEWHGASDVHSSLIRFCESLLQRLEALNRSETRLEDHEWIRREVEIRVSDCKALSSYGSSLLPFWWHTEAQLKQLESTISLREASLIVRAEHEDRLKISENSYLGENFSLQNTKPESVRMENGNGILSTVESSSHAPGFDESKLQKEDGSQITENKDIKIEGSFVPDEQLEGKHQPDSIQVACSNSVSAHLIHKAEEQVDEDIDMDVEMEVDEEPQLGMSTTVDLCTNHPSSLEQQVLSNKSLAELPPLPSDQPSVPPPPDEEWIPPPPPDNEPIPPPPPEEPPLPPPLPYCDTAPCPPYPDQFHTGYTGPAYQYYPSTVEVAAGNYYAQADNGLITEPQPPAYYDPVVSGALHAAAVDVNALAPVMYYDITVGSVPNEPVVSVVESSGYYIESGPFSYHTAATVLEPVGSVEFTMDTESSRSLLPKVNTERETHTTLPDSGARTMQASFVASTAQASSALINGNPADNATAASSKNQTKAVRKKKHTIAVAPSLKSNKKVSSLVDKWKAAKEELESDEDEEPKTAYEALEKKRQREIDEWRERQVASGEAQDNANFVPLGGDWHKRVKRKKAETEAAGTSSVSNQEQQQPDVAELSKDLPPGWQAYWDESSKGVYYGNSITMETTWTRPTR